MTSPKVSIVIPIYGVERFLSQCLDSVLAQTLKEIEIILVNDGSPDNCARIIDEYAAKDCRIVVAHLSNGGYGRAVNYGLDCAHGEYIGIVEPDDWVEHRMFEVLYKHAKANDAEVVKGRCYHYKGQSNTSALDLGIPSALLDTCVEPIKTPQAFKLGPTVWTAIYKKDFLNIHNIRFLETPGAAYQDTGFHFKVMFMTKRLYLVDAPLYHYRTDNEGSSVKDPRKVFCVCDEWEEVIRYLKEKNIYTEHASLVCSLQYDTYKWNWKRLSTQLKMSFFKTIAKEFKVYQEAGLLRPELLGKKKYNSICSIIQRPRWAVIKYELFHFPKKISKLWNSR